MAAVDHGPRISGEEYDRRIVALYEGLPPMPSREQDERVRRRELDILIDHRLGTRFPAERREALWAVQQSVERKRLRMGFESIARAMLPAHLQRHVQGLVGFATREYRNVLAPGELEQFLGLDERRERTSGS